MDRWEKKVAIVTGAGSGIGRATTKDLLAVGVKVVGLDINHNRLVLLHDSLPSDQKLNFHAIRCDVSSEEDVKNAFLWVENNIGGTDILINNAGIMRSGYQLIDCDNTEPMRETLDTFVMGAFYCVREAFQSMKRRNFDGHIVITNSCIGHRIHDFIGKPSPNMYGAAKFAITGMIETYRQEFLNSGVNIKITDISPGVVATEILPEAMRNTDLPSLKPEDVSNAILYTLSTPPHVQIYQMIIKPVGETF